MSAATTAPSGAGCVMWCASDPTAQPASSATGDAPRERAVSARSSTRKPDPSPEVRAPPPPVEGPARLRVERRDRVEAAERQATEPVAPSRHHRVDLAREQPRGRDDDRVGAARARARQRPHAREGPEAFVEPIAGRRQRVRQHADERSPAVGLGVQVSRAVARSRTCRPWCCRPPARRAPSSTAGAPCASPRPPRTRAIPLVRDHAPVTSGGPSGSSTCPTSRRRRSRAGPRRRTASPAGSRDRRARAATTSPRRWLPGGSRDPVPSPRGARSRASYLGDVIGDRAHAPEDRARLVALGDPHPELLFDRHRELQRVERVEPEARRRRAAPSSSIVSGSRPLRLSSVTRRRLIAVRSSPAVISTVAFSTAGPSAALRRRPAPRARSTRRGIVAAEAPAGVLQPAPDPSNGVAAQSAPRAASTFARFRSRPRRRRRPRWPPTSPRRERRAASARQVCASS